MGWITLPAESIRIWENDPPGSGLFPNDAKNLGLPTLTPYLIEDGKSRPVIIVAPGGGFQDRMPYEGRPIAEWLKSIGISAFVLNYRVAPYPPATSIRDAVRAVRYIRYHAQQLRIDPNRIGMIGFSAGGYLTVVLGTDYDNGIVEPGSRDAFIRSILVEPEDQRDPINQTSAELNAMILCYAGTEISKNDVVGELPEGITLDDFIHAASPCHHVNAKTPPAFIWVTADDEFGICLQNLHFAQALSNHRIPYEFHIFSRGSHGRGLGTEEPALAVWTKLCAGWLGRLWPEIQR